MRVITAVILGSAAPVNQTRPAVCISARDRQRPVASLSLPARPLEPPSQLQRIHLPTGPGLAVDPLQAALKAASDAHGRRAHGRRTLDDNQVRAMEAPWQWTRASAPRDMNPPDWVF